MVRERIAQLRVEGVHPAHVVDIVRQRRRDCRGQQRRQGSRWSRLEARVDVAHPGAGILPKVRDIAGERLGQGAVGLDNVLFLAGAGGGNRLLKRGDMIFRRIEPIETGAR